MFISKQKLETEHKLVALKIFVARDPLALLHRPLGVPGDHVEDHSHDHFSYEPWFFFPFLLDEVVSTSCGRKMNCMRKRPLSGVLD